MSWRSSSTVAVCWWRRQPRQRVATVIDHEAPPRSGSGVNVTFGRRGASHCQHRVSDAMSSYASWISARSVFVGLALSWYLGEIFQVGSGHGEKIHSTVET